MTYLNEFQYLWFFTLTQLVLIVKLTRTLLNFIGSQFY